MSVRNQAMTRAVQGMLEKIKAGCFSEDYEATDTEAMGLLLSHFFDYGGTDILKAAEAALEDANFHDASAKVGEIRAEVEAPAPRARVFRVPSQSKCGVTYEVALGADASDSTCTCPAFRYRHGSCKHIRGAALGAYGKGS